MKWLIDASYNMYTYIHSHVSITIVPDCVILYNKSSKQKLNTKSSTDKELVGATDGLG